MREDHDSLGEDAVFSGMGTIYGGSYFSMCLSWGTTYETAFHNANRSRASDTGTSATRLRVVRSKIEVNGPLLGPQVTIPCGVLTIARRGTGHDILRGDLGASIGAFDTSVRRPCADAWQARWATGGGAGTPRESHRTLQIGCQGKLLDYASSILLRLA